MDETATESTRAPFVIPQRDDDLLQCSNTIYYVEELVQDEDEIRDAMKAFRRGVHRGDFEHILAHFDHFFPLVRTPTSAHNHGDGGGSGETFGAKLRVELAALLIDSLYKNLISTLKIHICDMAAAAATSASANTTATLVEAANNNADDHHNNTSRRATKTRRTAETNTNRRYSDCLLMHLYLLSGLTNHFEQHMNKRTRAAVAATPGRGKHKAKHINMDEESDQIAQFWDVQGNRSTLIKVLYELISLDVTTDEDAGTQFWRVEDGVEVPFSGVRFLRTTRQIDDSMKMCILGMVCKFLENPEVCKASGRISMTNQFMLLRNICIYWNMYKAVARALMDLSSRLDYFQSAQATTYPFVDGIKSVQTDDEMDLLLREMIAYGSKLDTAVDSSGSTNAAGGATSGGSGRTPTEAATRAFALFISTTVEWKPQLVHKHLAFVMPFLSSDVPPMLRNAVLFVCTEILLQCFNCKELDQTMSDQRDMLFAHLTDHIMDKAALVRTRVLHLWAKLVSTKGAIPPIQFRLGLLWDVRGRLNDDSVSVRKAAATLLTTLVRHNRFGADLHYNTFFAQFLPVRRRFAALYRATMPIEATDDDGSAVDAAADGAYVFEDAYTVVGDERLLLEEDRENVQQALRDRTKAELDNLLDALLFITEIEKSLKQALEHVRQAQTLELAELLHFVCECVKFRLRDAMPALKRAFILIWRKDAPIVDLVTNMAYEALFSKNENTRIADLRSAQNLVEAMRRCTTEERVSLEETITRVFLKYGISETVLGEFWTYLDSIDPEVRLSAARLIVVVTHVDHRLMLPHLDRLYELYRLRTEHIRVEILRVFIALAIATQRKGENAAPVKATDLPPFRLEPTDKLVKLMSTFVFVDLNKQSASLWSPHCRQVVNIIYGVCLRPNRVINDLYDSILRKTKQCLDRLRKHQIQADIAAVDHTAANDEDDDEQHQQQNLLGLQEEETAPTDEGRRGELELVISRLLFFVGEVVLKFLSYAESTFSVHIKDTVLRRGLISPNTKRPQSRLSSIVDGQQNSKNNNDIEAIDGDEDDGLGQGGSDEEKNQMCLQRVLDKDTFANDTLIGRTMPVLMAVLENRTNWSNAVVESALLCLSKFMLVNARCCKAFLPAFFSFFDAASVRMRNNMIIMMTDLCFRFPNEFAQFNDAFIQTVRDENSGVRYTCLLMCAHLLLKDQIKISACVADIAYCVLRDDNPPEIVATASGLICELGKKHNALYNNVPAIMDRLLADEEASEADGEARVERILQFLLQWVGCDQLKRERLVDKLVERHGERLAGWRCVAQVLKAREAAAEKEQQQLLQQQEQQQQAQKASGSRGGGGGGRGRVGKTPKKR